MDQRGSQPIQNHRRGRWVSCNSLPASDLTYSRLANWPQWQRGRPAGSVSAQESRTPPWGCSSDSRRGIPGLVGGWRPGRLAQVWGTTGGPCRFERAPEGRWWKKKWEKKIVTNPLFSYRLQISCKSGWLWNNEGKLIKKQQDIKVRPCLLSIQLCIYSVELRRLPLWASIN